MHTANDKDLIASKSFAPQKRHQKDFQDGYWHCIKVFLQLCGYGNDFELYP